MVAYAVAFNFCVFGTLALGGRSNKQLLLSSSILHKRAPLTDDKRPCLRYAPSYSTTLFIFVAAVRYFLIYFNFKSATKFSLQLFMLLFSSQFRRVGKFKKPKDMLKARRKERGFGMSFEYRKKDILEDRLVSRSGKAHEQ